MNALRVGGFAGLLLVVGILSGCSLFFSNTEENTNLPRTDDSSSSWLIAAQGQGGPPDCVKALAPGQAKKLADKALKENVEVQALAQALKGKGKKLSTLKAHGCQVKKNNTNGQGLRAMQETATEATLVEVPAGSDAALYLLENESADEGNYWASLKGTDEGGQWLTHLEVGAASDGTTPDEPVGTNLFLPDETGAQEIAGQVQQLLAEASTQGQGLKALQLDGALDWSQAQIVLLDAETDEATAVLTIPPASTSGQVLWPGDAGSVDIVRAVNTAVKVQRQFDPVSNRNQWKVLPVESDELPVILPKPTPPAPKLPAPKPQPPTPPSPPKLVVKLGSELPDAFSYCPYQYYGKVTTLQRALCQDSWRQWYAKQWDNGSVNNQAFNAYNFALQKGAGAVAYLRDNKRGTQILAEGFAGLDAIQGRALLDYAAGTPQVPVNPTNQQAWHLLDQVDEQSLKGWFEVLLQAYKAGQFDQQYEQLIASEPGFADYQNKMQQLLQIAFDGVTDSTAPIDLKTLTKGFIAWASSLPFDLFSEPPQITCCAPNPFATNGQLDARNVVNALYRMETLLRGAAWLQGAQGHLNRAQELLDAIKGAGNAVLNSSLLAPEDRINISVQLLLSLAAIIENVDNRNLLSQFVGFQYCGEPCLYPIPISDATRLIDILNKIAAAVRQDNLTDAAQMITEIMVAGSAIAYGGWNFNGIDVPLLPGGKVVNLILSNTVGGQSILAFVQVYNTMRPVGLTGAPAVNEMYQEIARWIQQSLQYLEKHYQNGQYTISNGPFNVTANMGMLVLVFRGSTQDTQNMTQLAGLLKATLGANTNVPVLMVWEDINGQVWYNCVAACDKVSQSDMSRIACSMMGYDPSKCSAQDAETAGTTSSNSAASNKPTVVDPPPPHQISCGGPNLGTMVICAQDLMIPSSNP